MPRNATVFLFVTSVLASAAAAALPQFPAASVWRKDIRHAPVAKDSAAQLRALQSLGGWGNGDRMQIDFTITVLQAADNAPTQPVVAGVNGYYDGECAKPGLAFPLPPGGAIEGSAGYRCDPQENDCHLLVQQGNTLFESYGTDVTAKGVESTCAVVWRLDRVYPPQGRGDHCTSADAAGFPIAPLLLEADEVAAAAKRGGDLGHAIRFILPNARMAKDVYVRPASHAGGPKGPATSIAYGSRLRLRADFPMAGYNPASQAILRTMQHYGIVLADGGKIALTAADDRFSQAKWDDLDIDSHTFFDSGKPVKVTDFAVIDTGPRIPKRGECRLDRSP
ncbi:MAG TPA: hypothetical protein VFN09_07345 [Rhodanobacteraceae bacterium]|nr:hypothetical protein [Rhodanobacteraceae bacterium]